MNLGHLQAERAMKERTTNVPDYALEAAGLRMDGDMPTIIKRPGFTMLNDVSGVNCAHPETLRAILPASYTVSEADERDIVTVSEGNYTTRFSAWVNLWMALSKIANRR